MDRCAHAARRPVRVLTSWAARGADACRGSTATTPPPSCDGAGSTCRSWASPAMPTATTSTSLSARAPTRCAGALRCPTRCALADRVRSGRSTPSPYRARSCRTCCQSTCRPSPAAGARRRRLAAARATSRTIGDERPGSVQRAALAWPHARAIPHVHWIVFRLSSNTLVCDALGERPAWARQWPKWGGGRAGSVKMNVVSENGGGEPKDKDDIIPESLSGERRDARYDSHVAHSLEQIVRHPHEPLLRLPDPVDQEALVPVAGLRPAAPG
jgi:hypothetical protein